MVFKMNEITERFADKHNFSVEANSLEDGSVYYELHIHSDSWDDRGLWCYVVFNTIEELLDFVFEHKDEWREDE